MQWTNDALDVMKVFSLINQFEILLLEKRDKKLREKVQIEDKLPAADRVAEWMANSDRRRSSASSTDIDLLRRSSIVSNISAQSAGETEKEARKRKLEGNFVLYDELLRNASLGEGRKTKVCQRCRKG